MEQEIIKIGRNFDMKVSNCPVCHKDLYAYKPRILLMNMETKESFNFCDYKCLKEWLNENKLNKNTDNS